MSPFEEQLAGILLNLLSLVVTALVTYAIRYLKEHTKVKKSTVANNALDGLEKIAQAVVADFNQRAVKSVKSTNGWTPQYAQMVKRNAVEAMKTQGTPFIKLIEKSVDDIEPLLQTLIEQAIVKSKQK